ncbi:MAG TPA: TonB-dependent receptor [Sphingomicrobium sp.]|nr:TonB-dependent receptor [Sphingomicrobium sp.]
MFQSHTGIRKTIFTCGASILAISTATPALAQDATASDKQTTEQTKVTPNQVAGPVGAAQEREGQNGEIVVTGIRASIQASLNQKKRNDMVSEVITAEDIGKFPDKNVADSLGRLAGVNVVTGSAAAGGFGENSSVSIRGTDPTLNLTLLDGHSIATGDWFVLDQTSGGRSFDFSLLPSEIVGKLEVYKSSQADLPEGGIGGTINLHSRMPLDLPSGTATVTAQANYNDLAAKWEPQVSGLFSWKNNAESFGILAAGFYQKRAFRRDGQEFLGYTSYDNFGGSGQTAIAPNLIGEAYFRQMRIRKGGTLAVQFRPSPQFELDLNGIYTRMDANNVNTNSMAWISNVIGNAQSALTSYTIANGVVTSASWANTTPGGTPVNGRVQDDIFRDSLSSTWVINAEANWHPTSALSVHGELGYTKGEGETKDTYAWETYWHTGVSYAINGKTATVQYPGLPSDPTSAAYLDNYYSWSWGGHITSPDSEKYAKADIEYGFDNSWLKSIKVGGRYTDHKHSLDYIAYAWAGNGANSGTQNINLGTVFSGETTPNNYGDGLGTFPGYSLADQNLVLQELATNGGRQFDFYPQASFSVHEKDAAIYAMARFDNDSNWRGNIGVRAVHTDLQTVQYTPTPLPGQQTVSSIFCGACGIERVNHKYWDILPSANFTYDIRPDLLLRLSAARVMSRPGYAQLAGAFTLNDTILTGTAGGNPLLKPTRAWEYNAGLEWYYGKQSLLSATFFYLDISSYITQATFTGFYTTLQHPQGANFTITGPVNGPGGTNKGIELNWQQPLGYGFGVIANYTYADAKNRNGGPIDGNSKNTYNLTGYFENKLLSARFAYTFRSKFQSGIDRATPMWQGDYGQLDGSLIVHLTKYLDLTADAQNLLNHKLYYFVGDPSIPRAYYNNGRTFWVGAKATF